MNTPSNEPAAAPAPGGPAAAPASSDPAPGEFRLRRILIPLDFSAHSSKALPLATRLAREFEASLVLLHVTEPVAYPTDFGYAPAATDGLQESFQRDAQERLDTLAAELRSAGFSVETALRVGRPFQEISTAASELRADMIVVTTHGYTGLTHVLLGSTAERVVRHAPCPVLVFR